ncbi:hypothetical protein TW83_09025 [Paracoccus sp. S4493]|uniref:YbjQ family protein n=1 Tax=Paracoccus sp. S4493 TaxID=579490 RepID=UPI0005FA3D16|nr:heavy metal-binding domain-containing protein [Paracoccus sp. S4493]KJZ31405.1 hypothetical protein TW83_09025 [Paracoccus sp. S4493]
MAECADCGIQVSYFKQVNGRCSDCNNRYLERRRLEQDLGTDEAAKVFSEYKVSEEAIASVVLTTEATTDFIITRRIDIVTAECAFGMNAFKDLFAGVRNIVGGRSEAVQSTMRDARKTVLQELRREAHAIGANAVVGVDLDYVDLSGSGTMVMLVASGTAVVIQADDR